ncbi:MAG: hypothetical protein LBI89_00195 [Prevotellaceae bacterium]|jgi:uncharacterized protein (TIGR02145 family)|nr:hypothetical protein [Prevotellaceae bacterium]
MLFFKIKHHAPWRVVCIRKIKITTIVYMPDNKWWLAQNVKYAGVGSAISGCTEDECGRRYTWAQVYASYAGGTNGSSGNVQGICPPGWLLPVRATCSTLAVAIGSAAAVCSSLRPYNSFCSPVNDTYGFASVFGVVNGAIASVPAWYTNDAGREDGFNVDYGTAGNTCNSYQTSNVGESGNPAVVRCFRQL